MGHRGAEEEGGGGPSLSAAGSAVSVDEVMDKSPWFTHKDKPQRWGVVWAEELGLCDVIPRARCCQILFKKIGEERLRPFLFRKTGLE